MEAQVENNVKKKTNKQINKENKTKKRIWTELNHWKTEESWGSGEYIGTETT